MGGRGVVGQGKEKEKGNFKGERKRWKEKYSTQETQVKMSTIHETITTI